MNADLHNRSQESLHGSTLTRADTKDRWFGLAGLGVASQNLAVAEAVGIGAADAVSARTCVSSESPRFWVACDAQADTCLPHSDNSLQCA